MKDPGIEKLFPVSRFLPFVMVSDSEIVSNSEQFSFFIAGQDGRCLFSKELEDRGKLAEAIKPILVRYVATKEEFASAINLRIYVLLVAIRRSFVNQLFQTARFREEFDNALFSQAMRRFHTTECEIPFTPPLTPPVSRYCLVNVDTALVPRMIVRLGGFGDIIIEILNQIKEVISGGFVHIFRCRQKMLSVHSEPD